MSKRGLHRVISTTFPDGKVVLRTIGVVGLMMMSVHLHVLYAYNKYQNNVSFTANKDH